MAEPAQSPLVVSDLLAAVGEVMLNWGYLEVEMLKKLEASGHSLLPRVAPIQQWRTASARCASDVSAWTDEIERAAQIRNQLAHGFVGGYAQPVDGHPCVICRDIDGERKRITYASLKAAAQSLDLLRLRLRREPDDLLRALSDAR
ncbi:hypothetical protein [Brevundimonas sp.]|uniref:hypothetical protein n=1 Tax=Brevundimonas sp. TaxID=1871086 RepID=UPI0028A02429|nr:hypothetical protein [Brevundimonas sp.]